MRYLKFAVLSVLAVAMTGNARTATMKTGFSAQTANLADRDEFRQGVGFNGFTSVERATPGGGGVGGLGLRADYTHYEIEADEIGKNLNEGGIALTGLVGPNMAYFQPRVGGHVGYERLSKSNLLDLGADVQAAYKITPSFGIHAMVTPTWYLKPGSISDNSDYLTKISLGVIWTTPGA
jgi:hypothetical protein